MALTSAARERLNWLLLESVLIVISILLAFWIDAWWEDWQIQEVRAELKLSLIEDFRSNVSEIQRTIKDVEVQISQLEHFTALYEDGDFSSAQELRESVRPATWLEGPPLVDSTLDSAISDGSISLVTTAETREAISRFIEARESADLYMRYHQESYYLGPMNRISQKIGGLSKLHGLSDPHVLSEEELLASFARKDVASMVMTATVLRRNYFSKLQDLLTASEEILEGIERLDD